MIPMLRYFSSGYSRAIDQKLLQFQAPPSRQATTPSESVKECATGCAGGYSPTIMGEGLVRLSHLLGVLALLHCVAAVVGGIHDLGRQLLPHRLFAPVLGVINQPSHP